MIQIQKVIPRDRNPFWSDYNSGIDYMSNTLIEGTNNNVSRQATAIDMS